MTSKKLTQSLHPGSGETFVEVDGKLFKLIPNEEFPTVKSIMAKWPKGTVLPYVRHLNPIQERTPEEQRSRDQQKTELHRLNGSSGREDKITSLRKAAAVGANVPEEIQRLLKLKEETTDDGERRKIRRQLRALNYKRYTEVAE